MRALSRLVPLEEDALSAEERAYHFIRERVMNGSYSGGTRLTADGIASELGISRIPIREALRHLAADGLVTLRPNRGAVVTALTPADIEELFQIRAVLEGLAARIAAEHATEEDIDELRLLNGRLQRVRLDSQQWLLHHDEFHDFLCEIGRHKRLQREIHRIRMAVQPYILLYISVYRQTELADKEHEALIEAVRTGDGAHAEQALIGHVMGIGKAVLEFLQSGNSSKDAEGRTMKRSSKRIGRKLPQ